MDPLATSLLDLLAELEGQDIRLMVGGGFGLYLKRLELGRTGEETLFKELPEARSTNDIDLFMRAEVLADSGRILKVAEAIGRLGYTPVEEAKYMQWKRPVTVGGVEQEVKLDMLVGPIDSVRGRLHIKRPRVRPKGDGIQFHAHEVPEALGIEDEPRLITLEGMRSDGTPARAEVAVPRPFPYLLMKLHAFDDRKGDTDKGQGRHHALDLYSIVGMMNEAEMTRGLEMGQYFRADEYVVRARAIIRGNFSGPTALGMLRLREHPLFREAFNLEAFGRVLAQIFEEPSPTQP